MGKGRAGREKSKREFKKKDIRTRNKKQTIDDVDPRYDAKEKEAREREREKS